MYIHELSHWPDFQFSYETIAPILGDVRHKQGQLLGRMSSMGFERCKQAALETLTSDVVESSEIEGELLSPEQVRSSIARRLGMEYAAIKVEGKVEGVVEMILDATTKYAEPLTHDRLFGWHAALFPTGYSGVQKIKVAGYRDDSAGKMQVVSGAYTPREKVHFFAPSAPRLEKETTNFLTWYERGPEMDLVLKSGIAHLWFVTLHPFEDGNGRISRAIADMTLARSEKTSQRFYSMSAQIKQEHKRYYDMLEQTQKSSLDITSWLRWYLECLGRAIDVAQTTVDITLQRTQFWQSAQNLALNERHRKVLNLLLSDTFEGKLTAKKWGMLTKSSHDTALRDIKFLVDNKIFKQQGGGRNVSYELISNSDE
jgi:Fic family protein